MEILIGRQLCTVRRSVLKPYQAAFIARCSEREVKCMLRRGQRLAEHGCSPETILQRGALPVTWAGRNRRISPLHLAALVQDDTLALAILAALVESLIDVPRAQREDIPAPDLLDRADRL